MTATIDRHAALRRFARTALADATIDVERASVDASFRSYWRVSKSAERALAAQSWIVMDAPPDKEDLGSWLDIDSRLRLAGLHAPEILAVDRSQGFVLMEDLGSRTFLPELNEHTVDARYADALEALLRMQSTVDVSGLPSYDRKRLLDEMDLLPEWYLKRHLGHAPGDEEREIIESAFSFLADAALEQPQAFVHRDFHSRNLLIFDCAGADTPAGLLLNPAIVDFQDAVLGPITYDLVSLLRDCYVEWAPERVDGWVEGHRHRLQAANLIAPDIDAQRFCRWFDLMGLQRHFKVLGIFCRLNYRDGKDQYLRDLPLVWRYSISVARRYPELNQLVTLLQNALGDRDITTMRDNAST